MKLEVSPLKRHIFLGRSCEIHPLYFLWGEDSIPCLVVNQRLGAREGSRHISVYRAKWGNRRSALAKYLWLYVFNQILNAIYSHIITGQISGIGYGKYR